MFDSLSTTEEEEAKEVEQNDWFVFWFVCLFIYLEEEIKKEK
jgi:hypothetical protein